MSSGRRVSDRPPRSSKVYISFVTTSVDSPTPAREDGGVLEDRRLDVAVAGPPQRGGERLADGEEARRVRRQDRRTSPWGRGRSLTGPRPGGAGRRPAAASARYGLVARSRPIVVAGPWPGSTTVSSSSGRTTSRSERSIASHEPPGRSTRPTEPANSTSPASSPGASPRSTENITEPCVWPGRVPHGQLDPGQRQHLAVVQPPDVGRVGQPHPADQRGQRGTVPAGRVAQHAEVVGVQVGGDVVAVADRAAPRRCGRGARG